MVRLSLGLLVQLQILLAVAARVHHVGSLGRRNLEVVRLTKTLIGHARKTAESRVLIPFFQLAVMTLCPDQRQVPSGVLGTELARACTINHLRVVVIPLSVNLV